MTLGIFFFEGNVDGQFFVPKTFWWVGRELAGKQFCGHKNTDRRGYCGITFSEQWDP